MKAVQYRRFRDEVVAHFEAMGSARRAEIERVESALRNGTSVILAGHAGIGKSYVAADVVARVEPSTRGGDSAPVIRCTLSRDIERLRDLASSTTELAGILTVEDAHLLAADDLRSLADLVANSRRPVLVTIDVREVDMTSPADLDRSRLITSLWSSMGLDRVDLTGIGFNEAASMIDAASDGAGVDAVTRARIVHGAAGNPQLVTELTREALQTRSGYSVDTASLIIGPIALSPRILDLTRDRIAGLSEVDEYALVTLAKVGSVPYVRATRLVGQAPLRSLLRRGLVNHLAGSSEYVSANLLYANAAQAGRDEENPLEAEHTVEKILLAELRAGERLSSNECTIVATYWLNNPLANSLTNPLADMPAETAAAVFARAACRADMWGLPASAEAFARRSLTLWPTVAATEQLSRALAGQGMHTAAIELLERERLEHTDRHADTEYVAWWFMLLAAHAHDPERMAVLHDRAKSWGTVDDIVAQHDALVAMRDRLLETEYADGHEQLAAFAADTSNIRGTRLRALVEVIPAYSFLGMPDELDAAFLAGRDLIGELAMVNQSTVTADSRVAAAMFLAEAGLAKAILGQDRAGIARDLDGYALRSVLGGNEFDLALVNLVSGALSMASGRNARAESELARAEAGISKKVEPSASIPIRLLRGNTLAVLGRTEEARALYASLDDDQVMHDPWTDFYKECLEIVLGVDLADPKRSRDAFLRLARFKDGRSREVTMMALYGAYASGEDPAGLLAIMEDIAPPGRSTIGDIVEELLRALVAGDGHRLDAVGERFAAIGLSEQSGGAFHAAAAAHLAAGRSSDAAASFARRDAQMPPRAAEPVLAPTVSTENIARLTRRELEIAQLAGLGLSNSEIATRLFLSVRTVESHVLQARVKLGASRRSELGLYLAEFDRKVS